MNTDTMRTGTDDAGADAGTEDTVRIDDPVTSEYLDGLRTALVDLPAEEVGEIVEDARAHLADLAAELGQADDRGYDRDAVRARLGSPAAYAAELRTAAGFGPPPATTPRRRSAWAARFAITGLLGATAVAGVGGLAGPPGAASVGLLFLALVAAGVGVLPVVSDGRGLPSVAALAPVGALARRVRTDSSPHERARELPAFLARLQPGWWVLRAIAAAGTLAVLFAGSGSSAVLVGVVIAVVAVPVSVALGSRTRADRRLLWAVVPLNAFAATLVVSAVLALAGTDDDSTAAAPLPISGLSQDGDPVTDIRPFDAAGRPLSGVYLVDQDGRPLTVQDRACVPADAGNGRTGPFPIGDRTADPGTGECVTSPPEPMVVTIPGATPSPTAPRPTG